MGRLNYLPEEGVLCHEDHLRYDAQLHARHFQGRRVPDCREDLPIRPVGCTLVKRLKLPQRFFFEHLSVLLQPH
jgi:hypothetical protein